MLTTKVDRYCVYDVTLLSVTNSILKVITTTTATAINQLKKNKTNC